MIFLWAAFFLRTDLEKQIVPLACQLQIWAVALPDLFRTGSVPFLLGKHSPSLMLQRVSQAGRQHLHHYCGEPGRSSLPRHSLNTTLKQLADWVIVVLEIVITTTPNITGCVSCTRYNSEHFT